MVEKLTKISITVNGKQAQVAADPSTPLLWILRDNLGLTGTKIGCGQGLCGACTVLLDGEAIRSCQVTLKAVKQAKVITIEGLSADGQHPVQRAWLEENVAQCGYCQAGQMMSAVALLAAQPKPSDDDINGAMIGNICRCGTYQRIRKAIHRAAKGGKS